MREVRQFFFFGYPRREMKPLSIAVIAYGVIAFGLVRLPVALLLIAAGIAAATLVTVNPGQRHRTQADA